MKSISLNITKAASFLAEGAVKAYEPKVKAAQEALENGTCEGNDFLGWLHLPSSITPEFLNEIQAVANTLREKYEVWHTGRTMRWLHGLLRGERCYASRRQSSP